MTHLFLIATALVVGVAMVSPAAADRTWTVQPGDTLSAVATRFAVTVRDTMERNRLTSDKLRVGQQLTIGPPTQTPQGRKRSERSSELPFDGPSYTVARGDTLSGIANKLGISLPDLQSWNPGLRLDHIRDGQRLRLGYPGRRVRYRVRRGDTLTAIARKYRVSPKQVCQWNRRLVPDRLQAGQVLTLYTKIPASESESVGTPNRGKLLHARPLKPHRAYRIRDRKRAWGTAEAVYHIRTAFDRVLARFPAAPKVEVHDLSFQRGGPISHHRSHQSGRDADIAYFQKNCGRKGCAFRPVGIKNLDVKRQWALLEHWLRRDLVEAIFIDYQLQPALYRHAKKRGASSKQLKRWFQYPRGRGFPIGVVRHFPKHGDHMHVRFACHKSDKRCKTFRPFVTRQRHASR
ncbi:MAG: penicillin-insensitive murein endopeptidase [Myxococcales bacterium]|nr:penicillin-insensitive murein endopeptidase [Myxococcales bacterium]